MLDFKKAFGIQFYLLNLKGHYHDKINVFLLKSPSVEY